MKEDSKEGFVRARGIGREIPVGYQGVVGCWKPVWRPSPVCLSPPDSNLSLRQGYRNLIVVRADICCGTIQAAISSLVLAVQLFNDPGGPYDPYSEKRLSPTVNMKLRTASSS